MNLPGYQADVALARELVDLQLDAAPLALGMPRHPTLRTRYFRALAEAWEAGRLLPVKNLNLSEEDTDNAN
jgi:hypothetical protein